MKTTSNIIDSICNDIYKCVPGNRTQFDSLMSRLQKDFLNEPVRPSQPSTTRHISNPIPKLFSKQKPKDKSIPNKITVRHFSINKAPLIQYNHNFNRTLPDSEILCYKPFQTKQRKQYYGDLNANCKYYFPEEYDGTNEMDKLMKDMQWTNRANNIHLLCKFDSERLRKNQKEENENEGYISTRREFLKGGNYKGFLK